jgi:hypothetical protein
MKGEERRRRSHSIFRRFNDSNDSSSPPYRQINLLFSHFLSDLLCFIYSSRSPFFRSTISIFVGGVFLMMYMQIYIE